MKRSVPTRLVLCCYSALLCGSSLSLTAQAQSGAGTSTGDNRPELFVNDQTGYVYRKVYRTIERPTTETRMEQRTETVYTPQVVTTSRPETRTYYSPVVRYQWEPRWHGWWNPFTQPTLAYHAVPRAQWEARSESVNRTESRTEWVAEHRTREVPTRVSRIDRQTVADYEVVGRLGDASGAAALASNSTSAGASLRPLGADEQVIGLNDSHIRPRFSSPGVQIASTRPLQSLSTVTTDSRDRQQTGMAPTVLSGAAPPMLPVYGGSTIATAPVMSRWR